MELKNKIQGIIKDIESLNIEADDVGCDNEHYSICLDNLGYAAEYLYTIIYYIEKHEWVFMFFSFFYFLC